MKAIKNIYKFRKSLTQSQKFFSHKDQISQRNREFLQRVESSSSYTQSDFSNYLRVLNQNGTQSYDSFQRELPKHLSQLDSSDLRKVISIISKEKSLQTDEIAKQIKYRLEELKPEMGIGKVGDFSNTPASIRFWVKIANMRETFYTRLRKSVLSLK